MARLSITKAAERLLGQDDILILCHKYPDGDTIGSAFALCRALRSLGKRADVMCGDIIPPKFSYIFSGMEPTCEKERFIVAVDVADTALLGLLEKDYGSRVDLCIDHHPSNKMYATETLLDSTASAVGEVIFRLLPALGVALTQDIALALYTAICTDTGCFRYSNVTPRTHRIAAKLMETGIDFFRINHDMCEVRSLARIKLEHEMVAGMDVRLGGRLVMMTVTKDMVERSGAAEGDIDGLSAITRCVEGAQVGAFFREVEGGFKISLRTIPGVNASAICRNFGGGGHAAAAGCIIKKQIDAAKDTIYEAVSAALT